MYLRYLDESGNESDPTDRYFVLGGLALFERQTFFLSRSLDGIQEGFFPGQQPIAFHASEISSGRGFWRSVPEDTRHRVLLEVGEAIARAPSRGRLLFAAAVEKSHALWGEAVVEKATEEVCRRFDILLQRRYHDQADPQRGLVIFSEGRFNARARLWVRGFHQRGTSWGAINNLADIPCFASMRESRLLQAADHVAHAVWLAFERRNVSLLRPLIPCFDSQDGVLHGLVHVRASVANPCDCPACSSRRAAHSYGPWI